MIASEGPSTTMAKKLKFTAPCREILDPHYRVLVHPSLMRWNVHAKYRTTIQLV
jgi:hypothetical protein